MKLRGYKSSQTSLWSLQYYNEKKETWHTLPTKLPFPDKDSIIEWLDKAMSHNSDHGPEDTTGEYDIEGIHLQ